MSLASSVVIIVAVVIELSVGSIAGVAHWRFPTYVRTKRDLHVFRALRTRSFILRFQRFFSGDAHPSIQSWLVFAFLFRRRVRISRHRLFVVERIDVDAIRRRFCFHFIFSHTILNVLVATVIVLVLVLALFTRYRDLWFFFCVLFRDSFGRR